MTEDITVYLPSGGWVKLTMQVDMLAASDDDVSFIIDLFRLVRPRLDDPATPCACHPDCTAMARETPHSPHMDAYCDECTWHRCDVTGHARKRVRAGGRA